MLLWLRKGSSLMFILKLKPEVFNTIMQLQRKMGHWTILSEVKVLLLNVTIAEFVHFEKSSEKLIIFLMFSFLHIWKVLKKDSWILKLCKHNIKVTICSYFVFLVFFIYIKQCNLWTLLELRKFRKWMDK